ncbi:hypothetical protein AA0312_0605 [Acetobacter tropicalis NRIC 0312]|uniref:Uncharacterized protein n=1 Tax=Acetobacter tropicalis TaxID=104102 RepID=A0A511FQE1_9PROT|nr:hypothetical protein AD944_05960 [Acetobacter tropicalis]GBR67799.1 hypothetical protein AA0312_0605 [Acetobacter tropicalis NRIC 0312]GEL51163.1 hypothetical protein ATR01nite_22380 [Acetobacter tropicalis]
MGKLLIQSGKGNASLFAFYTLPSGPLKECVFGGGMRHSAKAYGGEVSYGSMNVPQCAVFNGSLQCDLSNFFPHYVGGQARPVCATSLTRITLAIT